MRYGKVAGVVFGAGPGSIETFGEIAVNDHVRVGSEYPDLLRIHVVHSIEPVQLTGSSCKLEIIDIVFCQTMKLSG
jgi:hypothetical protein